MIDAIILAAGQGTRMKSNKAKGTSSTWWQIIIAAR